MKAQPNFAQFWVLTKIIASLYVVTMADLKQNQQMTKVWAEYLHIIPERKMLLICEIVLQDQILINGESKVWFQR